MDKKVDSLNKQVGGDHYKKMAIQPLELTYWQYGIKGLEASIYTLVNKYFLRNKDNSVEDIDKAIHVLEILRDYKEKECEGDCGRNK